MAVERDLEAVVLERRSAAIGFAGHKDIDMLRHAGTSGCATAVPPGCDGCMTLAGLAHCGAVGNQAAMKVTGETMSEDAR